MTRIRRGASDAVAIEKSTFLVYFWKGPSFRLIVECHKAVCRHNSPSYKWPVCDMATPSVGSAGICHRNKVNSTAWLYRDGPSHKIVSFTLHYTTWPVLVQQAKYINLSGSMKSVGYHGWPSTSKISPHIIRFLKWWSSLVLNYLTVSEEIFLSFSPASPKIIAGEGLTEKQEIASQQEIESRCELNC